MLESIKKMLDCFEKYNIEYCHWKSNEHLEEALLGDTDLDILFNPEQRNLLEKVLSEAGLKRFRATPLMQYNAIEDYIGFDKKKAKIWHLHLHYRLSLGEKHLKSYTVSWTNYILSRRYKDKKNDIYLSNTEDEYFLLLIRMALKLRMRDFGKKIGKDDIVEINWLQQRCDKKKVISIAEYLIDKEVGIEIEKLLKINLKNKNQLLNLQKILRKKMNLYSSYNDLVIRLKRSIRELFWLSGGIKRRLGVSSVNPSRRISPAGGTVVAILGCDGAGKSTIISYLTKEFNKKIDVYSTYLGSGDGSSSFVRKPMKLVAKKVGGRGVGHAVEKELDLGKKITIKSRLYSLAKIIWAVTLAIEKKNKLKDITRARNNGLLVLIDRYPQVEVFGYSDGPLLSKYARKSGIIKKIADWEYNIYASAYINPPDLLVKLTVPTDIAIKRKPEMTAEEIENKKNVVNLIHCKNEEIVVNTNQELIKSISFIMESIWKKI